jgi:hypothetical protein
VKPNVVQLHPQLRYHLEFAPNDFKIDGRNAAGLPLLFAPNGELHEGVIHFFNKFMVMGRGKQGTSRVIAYILKEWLQFLDDRGIAWDRPSDQLLEDWVTHQTTNIALEGKPSGQRVRDKIRYVFKFYEVLQDMRIVTDLTGCGRSSPLG